MLAGVGMSGRRDHGPLAAACDRRSMARSSDPAADDLRDRAMRARIAAHRSWANTADPAARTKPARDAMLARFVREVDPDGVLSPADRARRAEQAKRAHFVALALKSAQARRRRCTGA